MRAITLFCIAFLSACGASAAKNPAGPADTPTRVKAALGGWKIRLEVSPGWSLDPGNQSAEAIIFDSKRMPATALAVMLEPAPPGSRAEAIAERWQGLSLLAPMFDIKAMGRIIVTADEENASFVATGERGGVPMTLFCIVHLVTSGGNDAWAVVLAFSPTAYAAPTMQEATRLVHTFSLAPLE